MQYKVGDFQESYKELNVQQKKAVDGIEGPVMVIAGPGTGKTQVLACRIANILATQDVEPNAILAMTFTDAAAKNMRDRVVSLVGAVGYRVTITTFHSFCREVIDANPEYIAIARGSKPLSDLERYSLFEQLLLETKLIALKPLGNVLHYLYDVVNSISQLKRENFSPEKFETVIEAEEKKLFEEKAELKKSEAVKREKNLEKQKELLTLYTKYEHKLKEKNRYDFDDMIAFVLRAFETNEELLLTYQEKFQYVLVDEFQDTNASQNKVVDLLFSYWGEAANVFVVGDPHQSIFRFQGASVENMLGFLQRYPAALVVTLEKGYRCPQVMYDAAHAVIGNNQPLQFAALNALLISQTSEKGLLSLYEAPTLDHEVAFITATIKKLLKEGTSPDNIAVLYKNHSDSIEVIDALLSDNILCKTDLGDSLFDDPYVLQTIDLCSLIFNVKTRTDEELLFKVLLYEWLQMDRATVFTLQRGAVANKTNLSDLLRMSAEYLVQTYNLETRHCLRIQTFLTQLEYWYAKAQSELFHSWFSQLISDEDQAFGIFSWMVTKVDDKKHIVALTSLFSEIKDWVLQDSSFSLGQFLENVTVIRKNALPVKVQQLPSGTMAITICSVHKAKGQEWEHVFVLRLRDKKWGNARSKQGITLPSALFQFVDVDKVEKNEEDRRLFYVAITRAKKNTYLSYPKSHTIGGGTSLFTKSMFLTEIEEHISEYSERELAFIEESVAKKKLSLPTVGLARTTTNERDFFERLVADFKLTVTALNAYVTDPQIFVWQSLLKVPKVKEGYLSYGTAIHAALESWYKKIHSAGSLPDMEYVLASFTQALKREALLEDEFESWLQQGKKALELYLLQHQAAQKPVATEYVFGSNSRPVILESESGPIQLGGRIDRIDSLDVYKRTVRIVDYKTGSIKTKNEIEGKTKTSLSKLSKRELTLPESLRTSYKRQLVFYKMLSELDPSFPFVVSEVAFEFLTPRENGTFAIEYFSIGDDEVAALKDLTRTVMKEIRNLDFLDYLEWG